MLAEFIGCSGSGKSTLVAKAIGKIASTGVRVIAAEELLLQTAGLGRIGNETLRRAAVNGLAHLALLRRARTYAPFLGFAARTLSRSADNPLLLPYLCRNVVKRLGVYDVARHNGVGDRIVILDEGTLQTAHNLFVHVNTPPNLDDVARFAQLAPMPDMVVFVHASEALCVARTMERGHRRVGGRDRTEKFIRHAHLVFERLAASERVERRLAVVENQSTEMTDDAADRAVQFILEAYHQREPGKAK